MVILLTGAGGFIGRRLIVALRAAGHIVIEGRRNPPEGSRAVAVDFTRDVDANVWTPRLAGVDLVINAVGILREHGGQTFARIHTRAPQALFAACAAAGVGRVVQISALGADHGTTGYFASKRAADEFLASLPLEWTIVQPSIVYGAGGTSARLFTLLASLPVIPLPGRGDQRVQPIYLDDLTEAIVNLIGRGEAARQRVALVGPQALELREFLRRLRTAMGLAPAWFLPVPLWMMELGARIAELSPRSLLDRETLAMLHAGVAADPAATHRLLRRPPRDVAEFVPHEWRAAISAQARLGWLSPILRFAIAIVWIWSGVVSLGLYPRELSYDLLARVGAPPALAPIFLYGAAALDFIFGAATLVLRRRRALWLAQIALIVLYTLIVTFALPEFWLHPFGPILKNLPMLAAIALLYALEPTDDAMRRPR
jgi:uncharacterized protein YbjT (DUF2867 family)